MMVSDAPAWREIVQSDLFTWFSMHEVGQERPRPGIVRRRLKPGGHEQAIDLVLELAGHRLLTAELALDRAWMDGAFTAPFADDLVKSVLLVLAPGRPAIGDAAQRIFHLGRGSQPRILLAVAPRSPDAPPAPAVQGVIDAYLGQRPAAELADGAATLTLAAVEEQGRPRLRLTLHHDAPEVAAERRPWWRRLGR